MAGQTRQRNRAEMTDLATSDAQRQQFESLWSLMGTVAEPTGPAEAVVRRVEHKLVAQLGDADAPVVGWPSWVLLPAATLLAAGSLLLTRTLSAIEAWPEALALLMGAAVLTLTAVRFSVATLAGVLAATVAFGALVGRGLVSAVPLELAPAGAAMSAYAVRCAAVEVGFSAIPLVVTGLLLWRQPQWVRGPWPFAAAAAAGALTAQAVVHLVCPGRELSHLLLAHSGGVVAAALIGLAVGFPLARRFSRAR